jgi:hypothetical protein
MLVIKEVDSYPSPGGRDQREGDKMASTYVLIFF